MEEDDILHAQFVGVCPGCNRPVRVNAEAALTKGPVAAFLAVCTIGMSAVLWSAGLKMVGIGSEFFQMRSWPEPKIAAAILPLLLLATIVGSSVGMALIVVKYYARMRLAGCQPREAESPPAIHASCPSCGHEWIGRWSPSIKERQCPKCQHQFNRARFVVDSGGSTRDLRNN
jgi:predicted RNA-binding Zn-ribbon protein involved in translation (DUF1610 family)